MAGRLFVAEDDAFREVAVRRVTGGALRELASQKASSFAPFGVP